MLTKENVLTLRRFASLYASIDQKETVATYLSIIVAKYASETGFGAEEGADFPLYTKVMKFFSGGGDYPGKEFDALLGKICKKAGQDEMMAIKLFLSENVLTWLFNNIDYQKLPGWDLASKEGEDRLAELRAITEAVNILSSMYLGSSRLGCAYNVVYDLAFQILDVKEEDIFADFVAGQGVSTFMITGGRASRYILSDLKSDLSISLLGILYGIQGLKSEEMALETPYDRVEVADKMFMDPPVNVSLSTKIEVDDVSVRDTGSAAILRMLEALKPGGRGVVTTAGKSLVGMTASFADVNAKLLEGHYLKAVITLPSCWVGTSVKTNLLVLSKEAGEGVMFIDASGSKVSGMLGEVLVNQEGEVLNPVIMELLENHKNTSISQFVAYEDIKECNITPVAYIKRVPDGDGVSVEDIDKKLSVVYGKMAGMIKDLQSLS